MPAPNTHSMFIATCTNTEIVNVFNNLKPTCSVGTDGYNMKVIKGIITVLSIGLPLANVFNCSFSTGVFPHALTSVKVTPIFKSDNKLSIGNYRPISVLPIFPKLLEKMMCNRSTLFINKCCILSQGQYGFSSNHSTFMALLDIVENLSAAIDGREFAIGISRHLECFRHHRPSYSKVK